MSHGFVAAYSDLRISYTGTRGGLRRFGDIETNQGVFKPIVTESIAKTDPDFPAYRDVDNLPQGYLTDAHLEALEEWLDQKFTVPIIGYKFGLDGLIGLIPGVGDLATTGVSAVFVADAIKAGARKRTVGKMIGNLALDFAVGAIPIVGDLFDFMFKSNLKNLRLLRREKIWLAENQR